MNKKGFTLIEMLATIALLAIIATISVPFIVNRIDYFKEKSLETMITSVENATEKYVNENQQDLDELTTFGFIEIRISTLIDEGYLSNTLMNPIQNRPVPLDDLVFVSRTPSNKIEIKYDENQKQNPKITINGRQNLRVKLGETFNDPGAVAIGANGSDLTSSIQTINPVNTSEIGEFEITYSLQDAISKKRYVIVTDDFPDEDLEKPILTSNVPNNKIQIKVNENYTMPVVTATDNVDATTTVSPSSNNVNRFQTGTYQIKYDYTDAAGNRADTLIITVVVTY